MVEQTESKVAEAPAITRAGVYGLWLGLAVQTAFGLMIGVVLLPRGAIVFAAIALVVPVGITAFFTVMISRGENWARIVYGVFYGLPSLLVFPSGLSGRGATLPVLGHHLPLAIAPAIFGAIVLCSIVMLFLPASNAWFRERTRARAEAERRGIHPVWYLAAGIVASLAVDNAGFWLFVAGRQDWDALGAGIFNFLAATVGLGVLVLLGSLFFDGRMKASIALAGVGALCGLVANPVADVAAYQAWKLAYLKPKFALVCRKAHIDVRSLDTRPAGVLFAGRPGAGRVSAEFLLNQSELQFVEREARRKPGDAGPVAYERIEVEGERIRRSNWRDRKANRRTHFNVTPVAAPSAALEASMSLQALPGDNDVSRRKIRLIRRSDGAELVSALIFRSRTLRTTCPEGGSLSSVYATNLILRAMRMPEIKP